jgi:hypothetical protein
MDVDHMQHTCLESGGLSIFSPMLLVYPVQRAMDGMDGWVVGFHFSPLKPMNRVFHCHSPRLLAENAGRGYRLIRPTPETTPETITEPATETIFTCRRFGVLSRVIMRTIPVSSAMSLRYRENPPRGSAPSVESGGDQDEFGRKVQGRGQALFQERHANWRDIRSQRERAVEGESLACTFPFVSAVFSEEF